MYAVLTTFRLFSCELIYLIMIINTKFYCASVFHVVVPYLILTDSLLLRDLLILVIIFHALRWGVDWKDEGQTAVIFHSLLLCEG